MTLRKTSLVSALLLPITGCGWLTGDDGYFRDRGDDYRKATVEAPLAVPQTMSSSAIEPSYAIPSITNDGALEGEFEVPRPESMDKDPYEDFVKIQKLGNQQWIVVDAAPGQIWPRVLGFLNAGGLEIANANTGQGIVETGWLKPLGEGLSEERYRFRIEQGVQRGSGEVYILQMAKGAGNWPAASTHAERETIMLQELAQYIANTAGEASVSMVAQKSLDADGRIFMEYDSNKQPFLRIQLPFVRAWASLGVALGKAGFEVEDLNRTERTYFVSFDPSQEEEQEEPSWWERLTGGDDEEREGVQRYRVTMTESGRDSVQVKIDAVEGAEPLSARVREALLKQIRSHLS